MSDYKQLFEDLKDLVVEMRKRQNAYYEIATQAYPDTGLKANALASAKRAERVVDKWIVDIDSGQERLFT